MTICNLWMGTYFKEYSSYMVKTVYANGMPDGFSNKADNKKYPTLGDGEWVITLRDRGREERGEEKERDKQRERERQGGNTKNSWGKYAQTRKKVSYIC